MRHAQKEARKIFVVDTSLLLHDPKAILSFEENIVVIPFPVLEELDAHRHRGENGTAAAARQATRILDDLRQKGQLHRGVETPGGGSLLVDHEEFTDGLRLDVSIVDNFIIAVAMKWRRRDVWMHRKRNRGKTAGATDIVVEMDQRFALGEVILITKDINLRVKAGACKIAAQDYLKDRAVESKEKLYTGLAHIPVSEDAFKHIAGLVHPKGMVLADEVSLLAGFSPLLPNQCCIFEHQDKSALAVYKYGVEPSSPPYFLHVPKPKISGKRAGIEPRNAEQALALALLMDRDIQIITLSGIAGSGKTLMALLAGLKQVVDTHRYEQILVYRSNTEIGESLGFLKGSLKQKFSPWAAPIHDILGLLAVGGELELFETGKQKLIYNMDELMQQQRISIDPINHVRGRSFHYKFVVVDETQNFKPGDIKKVITRVGKGTKIVLTGDVAQIDSPYLDSLTNGLSHVIERMKGQTMFAHLTLENSERSGLADLAARLL